MDNSVKIVPLPTWRSRSIYRITASVKCVGADETPISFEIAAYDADEITSEVVSREITKRYAGSTIEYVQSIAVYETGKMQV